MGLISKDNEFSAGATIVASEHNDNFDTMYNAFNGNIANANISDSAAIAYSKLNLTGTLLNADIATDASIAGTKLNLASVGDIGTTLAQKGTFTTLVATDLTLAASGATCTVILDEDDMASDSAVAIPTQQSVKAYADNLSAGFWSLVQSDTFTSSSADIDISVTMASPESYRLIIDGTGSAGGTSSRYTID